MRDARAGMLWSSIANTHEKILEPKVNQFEQFISKITTIKLLLRKSGTVTKTQGIILIFNKNSNKSFQHCF